jgi:DNA-binding response OmpR family regulator
MAARVLLIDDDEKLGPLLSSYVADHDFRLTQATSGPAGLTQLQAEHFDLVILDLMMPGMNGLEVCRRIRERSRIPVLMLTAKGDETDRVVGLELGADDYVAKPFGPRELVARLRALLRRALPESEAREIRVADLVLVPSTRSVRRGGQAVDLTGIEFDLLLCLAERAGRVVGREALLELAGRDNTMVSDRTVDVHISHLRQKLKDDPRAPTLIKTVRGVGYVLAREMTA